MRIKHWQGYGTVTARKIKDKNVTLHISVSGLHEWGLRRDDMYDLFRWLIRKFDKSVADMPYAEFYRNYRPNVFIQEWDIPGDPEEHCDYYFIYGKQV